ncbi:GIY-YIG nuclease family protein [Xanthomonas campestris pv. mirabilis]|uniref:GIY-YIG nuclease family protein n=1 Tax=Xanthomonas euvesicatoria TaxID=456327 RepID=UPI001C43F65C|nr:GIY-YIG nuclease family protein [Xanthomonas euvesicatoria]MBV6854589.1 GIY-YIG nuclease family protein [Xanthomonas campestris pv. mirabilis]
MSGDNTPMDAPKPWHLYLLLCRNGSYYAGITNDLERRFQAHLRGTGARYTRANPPVQLLASHRYPDRASASRAECALKRQPRARKLAWLQAQPNCAESQPADASITPV